MSRHKIPDGYYGHILKGNYSQLLKDHIVRCIHNFQAFDRLETPAIPYIAAWQETQHVIWYEFVGRQLIQLLGCDDADASEIFRNSIVERHIYSKMDRPEDLQEVILKSDELLERKSELREEVKRSGILEAVYKVAAVDGKTYWLKDQAKLESFESDQIYISLGNLTVVTKEMEAEEHLKQVQDALRKSEQEFKEQAIHDNLTGLFNTRYLYTALPVLIKKSAAGGDVFSLVFMDIDDFKQVVDTHGHLNASKTLQEVGATLMDALPAPAFGVAYGGDEFVLVLPGFDKQQALEMAETIRQRIKETIYLQKAGLNVRIHSSLGVSTFPDDADTLTELLALADQAMFSVKERGKDSVCGIFYETTKDGGRIGKIVSYDCQK
ncbi:MAG: GGDEF domain-containing protein [Deltaproteobacteria bacterium]|jgi:diguanylate cyclase (GGDEF)-like protein|nr:GGDEF domain-containing protein [Deltaproteobacteria bacterium]